ncbi:MAG: sulfatase [Anditalea sp.]
MTPTILIKTFVIALVLQALTSGTSEVKAQKPNIIFILADDLGWADLPVYGNRFNESPNLDQLACQGMRFTNAYAACPVCSPTRASILSGQYPARVGVIDFIPGHWRPYEEVTVPTNRTQYLPEEIFTIGEALKDAGYATGYFGKWHLGGKQEHHPLNRGFDEANVGQGYYNAKFDPSREQSSEKILSARLTDFSKDFIEAHKDEPFFLFLSHYDVHVQLDADRDLIDKYLKKERKDNYPGNAIYAAMIENLDRSVGSIVAKLKETGLAENTIIVFYSDNGGLIGRYDRIPLLADSKLDVYKNSPLKYIASSNAPLRGEKGTVYEGGIREPLIVKWPGKIKEGSVSDAIVTSVDFYPTLLDLAGAANPTGQVLDGKSLVPELLENKYDPERAIFWHYPVYHHDVPAGALRKGDWKLIENQVSGKFELYNLRADISEAMDLSTLYPEKTEELTKLLRNWQKEVKAEFPVPNPDFDASRRGEWGKHPDRYINLN